MIRLMKPIVLVVVLLGLFAGNICAGEKVFYYHTDPAGTPMAMTDSSGKVVWRADYRPFGDCGDGK